MNYAIKYDHKLNRWIVYDKSTKKIESKHYTKEQAQKHLRSISDD